MAGLAVRKLAELVTCFAKSSSKVPEVEGIVTVKRELPWAAIVKALLPTVDLAARLQVRVTFWAPSIFGKLKA